MKPGNPANGPIPRLPTVADTQRRIEGRYHVSDDPRRMRPCPIPDGADVAPVDVEGLTRPSRVAVPARGVVML